MGAKRGPTFIGLEIPMSRKYGETWGTRSRFMESVSNRLLSKSIFALLVACVLWIPSFAQSPRGSLRGAVQDPTGARIPKAKIVVQAADSSLEREAESEDRGEFRVDDLPPGSYRITVSASGFAQAEAAVSIAVSSVREVTVTLKAE